MRTPLYQILVGYLVIVGAVVGAVVYVAIHFIAKYW